VGTIVSTPSGTGSDGRFVWKNAEANFLSMMKSPSSGAILRSISNAGESAWNSMRAGIFLMEESAVCSVRPVPRADVDDRNAARPGRRQDKAYAERGPQCRIVPLMAATPRSGGPTSTCTILR
jgi:hypothetical protein